MAIDFRPSFHQQGQRSTADDVADLLEIEQMQMRKDGQPMILLYLQKKLL